MFYAHLLCNAINENINSIYNLNRTALPPSPVPKTPEEAVSENNPDREIWIEEIIKELKCIETYDILENAPQRWLWFESKVSIYS
jgi:hypothetical protein